MSKSDTFGSKNLTIGEAFKISVYIFRRISETIEFIHKNGIILRNLGLKSILVSKSGRVKIVDFTAATNVAGTKPGDRSTIDFIRAEAAPELINTSPKPSMVHNAGVTHGSDVYGFGATCLAFLSQISTKRYD